MVGKKSIYWNKCSVFKSDIETVWCTVCFMKHIFIAPWTCLHSFDIHIFIRRPENVRSVNKICLHCGHFIPCYIMLIFFEFVAVHDSLWLLVVHPCYYRTWNPYFGLSNCNIIPLAYTFVMLNFVCQLHTGRISYTSINNNGYFQGMGFTYDFSPIGGVCVLLVITLGTPLLASIT